MTKRLVISMLATVWAILIASGVTAYFTTRSVLIANMDDAMVMQTAPVIESDRYIARNDLGQTIKPAPNAVGEQYKPVLQWAKFVTLDDGTRMRTVSVRTFVRKKDGQMEPVTATTSKPTADLDKLLNRLAAALVIAGCAGGAIAAVVARVVAKATLRPLRTTAEAIGAIDEQNLSRRIDASKLAPELIPVAERLNEMLARLEESFENRKRFLADASHELRTPVAAMVTTLEVSLRRLRDAESYRETMQTCLADARLLRVLVDALMRQARSEIAAFREEAVNTDVAALLHECVAILTAIADEKSIKLSVAIDEPITLQIPPGRLKQTVMGLLENGIDHNRPGGAVELSARVEGSNLQILIRDTGPGIAPEHLPRIFEPFYRVSPVRDVSGHMGLGLYLVKTHIDALNGSVSVESEPGRGTIFRILLPVRKAVEITEKPLATQVAGVP